MAIPQVNMSEKSRREEETIREYRWWMAESRLALANAQLREELGRSGKTWRKRSETYRFKAEQIEKNFGQKISD